MRNPLNLLLLVLALAAFAASSVYTVPQGHAALVRQLGQVVATVTEPGLYFKWPLVQDVIEFDARILTIDAQQPERFITAEKKPVLVDYFVKWRIADVRQFWVSVAGDEERARSRLVQTVNDDLRAEFAKRTVHEAVSGERDQIVDAMRMRADRDARTIGVTVLDVRIKRVDLTPEVSDSVYRRMQAERQRVANQLRSTGDSDAERIKADADRQREVILAEAFRDAQKTMGEGDAKAAAIYAEAYGRDSEFYAFYRSLESYKQSLHSKADVLVLDPNTDYFRYFRNAPGLGRGAGARK
ncbi:MAG: protease modulator HflC [Pseudomonadota bacterium]|nr:protease modulator HflC [Pseudomonadota bacterium]